MSRSPSIESIEGSHNFPGPFRFKLFGPMDQTFVDGIRAHVAPHLGDETNYGFDLRPSSKGAHCCVTLTMVANSAEEVQKMYDLLHDTPQLRMLI